MPASGSRQRRRIVPAVAVLAAATLVAGAVATAPAASASLARPGSAPAVYAVNQPICAQPANPQAMRCYGYKQVVVPKGTPGAYRTMTAAAAGATTDASAAAFGGYSPKQLAAAYHFNPKAPRSNITVGIVLWHDSPTVLSDLNRFDKANHLPKETKRSFRKVNERGQTSKLPKRDRDAASEIALDTQAVRGVCNTCRILLVEADGPYDSDLANAVKTAVRMGATIVTNSYGRPERSVSKKFAAAYNHPGVAILASTGDSGWYGWDDANDPRYVSQGAASFPATSPSVIAVGGTTLVRGANGRFTDTVWNNNGDSDTIGSARGRSMGASGGGCSRRFKAPDWQRRTPGYAQAHCGGYRLATDVSVVADPRTGYAVYDTYGSGGKIVVGGTSLSAPLAAGMYALAKGPRGARYPATALYASAAARPGTRFDVIHGGSGYCGGVSPKTCSDSTLARYGTRNPNGLDAGVIDCSFPRSHSQAVPKSASRECAAAPGFDGASGVGAPRSISLFARSDPYLSVRVSGKVRPKRAKTFRAGVSVPVRGTRISRLTFSWGDHHKATTTTKRSAKHTYRKAGRYTITLTSHDSRGQVAVTKRKITVR